MSATIDIHIERDADRAQFLEVAVFMVMTPVPRGTLMTKGEIKDGYPRSVIDFLLCNAAFIVHADSSDSDRPNPACGPSSFG